MMNRFPISFWSFSLLIVLLGILSSCSNPRSSKDGSQHETGVESWPITVNIYVENSGSMAGFCNVLDQGAIETLVRDYYDRFDENPEINRIGLNFINTSIESSNLGIKEFTNSIKRKCTASYTKLNEMLEIMADSIKSNRVNIFISDCGFTSNDGNLAIAASGITSQFSRQLNKKDFAVAIYKYMVNFDGKYYPGAIPENKPLPLYVWVFGNKANVQKVTELPYNSKNSGTFFLQKPTEVTYKLLPKSSRMIKDGNICVSKWKKDRYGDFYELSFVARLDEVLLSKEKILDVSRYNIQTDNSTKYEIVNIEEDRSEDYSYKFTIRSVDSNPAPGRLRISYPIQTPGWVAKSNFEGSGIPPYGTTFGVSYLIEGVAKAFENTSKNNNFFVINISFVK